MTGSFFSCLDLRTEEMPAASNTACYPNTVFMESHWPTVSVCVYVTMSSRAVEQTADSDPEAQG